MKNHNLDFWHGAAESLWQLWCEECEFEANSHNDPTWRDYETAWLRFTGKYDQALAHVRDATGDGPWIGHDIERILSDWCKLNSLDPDHLTPKAWSEFVAGMEQGLAKVYEG